MKRKSKILTGSAIVFVALLIALFLARKQFVGGPGSPTVEGSRAVTDGGIKIPGWNGRVDEFSPASLRSIYRWERHGYT